MDQRDDRRDSGDELVTVYLRHAAAIGGAVAIVGLGIAGYDYSRRSGADLLERGIWQGPAAVQPPQPPLGEALPEFVVTDGDPETERTAGRKS